MRKTLLAGLLGLSALTLSACAPLVVGGVGAGALMLDDRRTSGTYLVDEEIELKAGSTLRESFGANTHVNLTSYNRRVLLTGEVPDAANRAKVKELVMKVANVRDLQDELSIGPASGYKARATDGYITAKVKTRFLDDKRFEAHHVKVITEAGVVYLMGLVKREEGNAAAEVASRTSGVTKVVKVFEYLD
jgi:osmotically-inducible protein OsmY